MTLSYGGRGRFRTCDPYDVNVVVYTETKENQTFSGAVSGICGAMFRRCSRSGGSSEPKSTTLPGGATV